MYTAIALVIINGTMFTRPIKNLPPIAREVVVKDSGNGKYSLAGLQDCQTYQLKDNVFHVYCVDER